MRWSAACLLSHSGIDLAPIRELGLLTAKPYHLRLQRRRGGADGCRAHGRARSPRRARRTPCSSTRRSSRSSSTSTPRTPPSCSRRPARTESGLDQLARIGFDTLGLQTYLTAGPKEARAWTIGKGWKAPQAAGVIHTDFEKGFIKAEVISFDDLVDDRLGRSRPAPKGKARIEGKDYVMHDGDVVEFRFNV